MTRRIVSFCTGMALGWGAEITGAAESMLDIEAKPTIAERLSHDIVKGTLVNIDGESYWVRDTNGRAVTLHVDGSTKRNTVMVGDQVNAYVDANGHTTTLQRDE